MNAWIDWPEDRHPHYPAEALAGEVPIVWLHNPESRNAMTPDLLADLQRCIRTLAEGGHPILLAGKGPCFSAGFDLKLCRDNPSVLTELLCYLHNVIAAMRAASVPIVIAAHGAAVAGACALFGGADYIVTDATSKIGYPVVRFGLSPAVSAPFLSQQIVAGQARQLMLDPSLISGEEALRVGLVHECVAVPNDVLPAAKAMARALASKPRAAFAATKDLLREIESEQQQSTAYPPTVGWPVRGLDFSLATASHDETHARIAKLTFK